MPDGRDATGPTRAAGVILSRPPRASGRKQLSVGVQSGIWYQGVLRDDLIAAGGLTVLCEQFAVAIREVGEPAGACLFAITEEAGDVRDGSGHASSTALFFSPSAISAVPDMLARCDAQPSHPPDRARASLLVGRPTDWDLLPRATH